MRRGLATAALAIAAGLGAGANGTIPALAAARGPTPERVAYGALASQFGELWLPQRPERAPVVVMVHGGCWQRGYALDLMDPLSAALREQGIAVWNIEYRRLGEAGGGYPGTFADTAAAVDVLRNLATKYPLDLARVVAVGHSAGGHLALWAAARPRLPAGSALRQGDPQPISGVVTLAGINDLAAYRASGPACGGARTIDELTGALGRSNPLADTSPRALLPLGVRQLVVSGDSDGIVPASFGRDYATAAAAAGDPATELTVPGDHFALIDPSSAAWREVRTRVADLLAARR